MRMHHQRGFNLIELMLVLILVGIVAGIGIPSFREFIATQRVKSTAFEVAAVLLLARSEATLRKTTVSIARSGDSWSSGWTIDVGDSTVATQKPAEQVTITAVDDPDAASIAYKLDGRVVAPLRLEIAGAHTDAKRCITFRSDGVPRTLTTACPEL